MFIAFCCLASGFYAINDVLDAEKDRSHPVKRTRPVAAGVVLPGTAVWTGLALIAASMVIGWAINLPTLLMLAAYAVLQVAYNVRLKRVILVDVTALAIGFALRASAGAAAIEVKVSIWLLLSVFFLCLFLAFIKRLCDLASAERAQAADWQSPAGYDDRDELNWLLAVSGVLAVLTIRDVHAVGPDARPVRREGVGVHAPHAAGGDCDPPVLSPREHGAVRQPAERAVS